MKKVKILSLLLTLSMVGCLMSFPAQATVSDAVRSEAAQPDAPASEPDMIVSETREVIEYGTSAKPEEDASKGASSSAEATTLADGVYAIKNVMYSSRWMSVEGGYPLGGSIHLQQTAYSASPVSNFTHLGLFKISRVGTTNRYIIRTLTSNDVSFGISGNQLVSKIIPSNDASVAASDTFYIEPYSGGYKIRPYGSSSVIYISSTSTTNVGLIASGSATTAACWTFEPYTGNHRHGCTIYRPSSWKGVGMIQEQTTSTAIAGWSTRINVNDVSAAVVSGDEALADLSWNTTANNLTIIPNNPGRLNFQVYIGTSANPRAYTISSFDFSIVPPTGTYYIQNVGTDKCIDIEGPSKASGAVLQQWQFHIGSQEKWILEHVPNSDGRVRFKSLYSNLYMGIDSANTTSVKQYGTQNDYTLWLIDRTASGNLILTCKATGSSGVVLSVPLNSNANGTNLTQLAYTDNTNYRDEWKIYKLQYLANVNNYYDKGYSVRYGEAESVSQDIIHQYSTEVAKQYMILLGIEMGIPDVQYYLSPIDVCKSEVSSQNIDKLCINCTPAHTDRTSVSSNFSSNCAGNNTTVSVLWTCHKIKSTATNGTINYNRSCSQGTCVYMLEISSASSRDTNSKGVLMHEINHQFGAVDHYHELADIHDPTSCKFKEICSECGDNPRPTSCIMYQSRKDISASNIICTECVSDMENHLMNHHVRQ